MHRLFYLGELFAKSATQRVSPRMPCVLPVNEMQTGKKPKNYDFLSYHLFGTGEYIAKAVYWSILFTTL